MRVLLLGATGNVGSRLLPALHAHNHEVVAYVRNASKLPAEAKRIAAAVASGSATDSASIKSAILTHNCDALVNAAGVAFPFASTGSDFPAIFAAVVKAATDANAERGGPALRCWFMSGWSLLDSPKPPHLVMDYLPLYPMHRPNYELIQPVPTHEMAWSLFCANTMPQKDTIDYARAPGNDLIGGVDAPPAFASTLQWVPLIGTYLSIMAQSQGYAAPLEDCVDFIASDLARGLESAYVGKRVGVKVRAKP